jgi:hypothetical protein
MLQRKANRPLFYSCSPIEPFTPFMPNENRGKSYDFLPVKAMCLWRDVTGGEVRRELLALYRSRT